MIQIDHFYRCNTAFGTRTVKAVQELESSDFYGIFSISEFQEPGDNQGMVIPNNSPEATPAEAQEWENWFNQ